MKKGMKITGNSLGAAGFVLGIFSILSPNIGFVLAILGFIFCFIQKKNKPTKLAMAGMILSIAGLVISILYWVFWGIPSVKAILQTGV
jgi:hypothetical protein